MFKSKFTSFSRVGTGVVGICGMLMALSQPATAQSDTKTLNDLSSFNNPGKTWSLVSDVVADLSKVNTFTITKGEGIILNYPDKKNHGADLFTSFEHGDADFEFEYMLAKGSNSGIYLQSRYELQIEDSWGIKVPSSSNHGGVYQRWNDVAEWQPGYEGYAPRQNASRAPGTWQKLKISFRAPRFDGSGKKTGNATLALVELNGVIIHENLELLGPTRGAVANDEKAKAPLRIQGDHGAIAFRNIKVKLYDTPQPINVNAGSNTDPILVDAPTNTILRSFMDVAGFGRVVHAVSVGTPENVHYTYDMDRGALIQVWRGGFLNATPMWNSRGDGSSRPEGVLQVIGKPSLALAKLSTPDAAWAKDTTGTSYRPKGYVLDKEELPTFRYQIYGATVNDAIRVTDNGQGVSRNLTIENAPKDLFLKLTSGSNIVSVSNGLYLVDGKSYYVRLDNTGSAKPVIRDADGGKELILPVSNGKVSYSILF